MSSTHEALSAMPCFAMGEAAGTAAAMAHKSKIAPRKVPVPQLHQELLRASAYLGETIK